MDIKSVTVFAPATVANVGPGFDILGFAIDSLGDTLTLTECTEPGLSLEVVSTKGTSLPADPLKNAATAPILTLARTHNISLSHRAILYKNMPIGSGLGSSAASAAAGAFAANELLGLGLSRLELVQFAMDGEQVACGSPHADNVAPALLGGISLIQSYSPLRIFSLPNRLEDLWLSVIHPDVLVETEQARNVLPKSYPRDIVVAQLGQVSALIAGFTLGSPELLAAGAKDFLAQPYRSRLIPGYDEAQSAALSLGALSFGISGSGPSVFALSLTKERAAMVSEGIAEEFKKHHLQTHSITSAINMQGAVCCDAPIRPADLTS
jgi:homoserine kinase